MRLLRFVRQHPIALLGVFVVAFVVWLWRDSFPDHQDQANPGDLRIVKAEVPLRRTLPALPEDEQPPPVPPQGTPQGKVQALSRLKPGMTRVEVEGLVGAPQATDIHPATIADGRVTYHTSYEADLEPPPTVRPIRPLPHNPKTRDPMAQPNTRTLVTLEFDATKPGHPLLGVHYPDPLF
jgi:hypothetical protein